NAGAGITGGVLLEGGAGTDAADFNGRAGDDAVTLRLTGPGAGSVAGLGPVVRLHGLDPASGVVHAPTGPASGRVLIGRGAAPAVDFGGINGAFSVNGDGDGSGDRDVLEVLGVSTFGRAATSRSSAAPSAWKSAATWPTRASPAASTWRRPTSTATAGPTS